MCAVTHSGRFLASGGFPTENSRHRATRLTLVDGRFFDGATFVLPNAQLATSLLSILAPHAFSCHNVMGERASPGGGNGWDSPSVSCHRVLSARLNDCAPGYERT